MGKHKKNHAATEEIKQFVIRLMITDDMITQTEKRMWRVKSESHPDKIYTVRKTNKRIICDCPYHTKREGAPCKHTTAVKMLTLQEAESIKPRDQRPGSPYGKWIRAVQNASRNVSKRTDCANAPSVAPSKGTSVWNLSAELDSLTMQDSRGDTIHQSIMAN